MPATATLDTRDFWSLAPEMVLAAWGLIVLIVDFSLLRRASGPRRRMVLGTLTLVGTGATLATMLLLRWTGYGPLPGSDLAIFSGTLADDLLTRWLGGLIVVLLAMVVGMSMAWSFTEHWGEYFALLCWAGVGMMLLIASEELLTLFLSLEMMTICLYLAAAFEKGRRRSAEAGLKYFVYGSVSSALFLFGLSLLYGMTGTTRLDAIAQILQQTRELPYTGPQSAGGLAGNVAGAIAVLLMMVGFGFKVAAVPFHQWAPDAYEGAPAPVSAWIATGSKVASFVALMKVLLHALGPWAEAHQDLAAPGWIGLVAILAAVTMTFGNLAALAQRNFKRMLAYSSIAHAGYLLVGVLAAAVSSHQDQAVGAVLYYLVIYALTTVGAFSAAAWLARDGWGDDIDDLDGLGARSPFLAVCLVLLMLSLIGVPPLAGFFGKLYMFMEALNVTGAGRLPLMWLVALGLLNSVISAFYYVRVLKAMFLRPTRRRPVTCASPAFSLPILLATVAVIGFGLGSELLISVTTGAASPMLTLGTREEAAEVAAVSAPVPALVSTASQLPGELAETDQATGAEPTTTPPEPTPIPTR